MRRFVPPPQATHIVPRVHTVAGAFCALGSATLVGAGIVAHAIAVRGVERRYALRPSLLLQLARSAPWLVGVGLVLAGWALQALALGLAPLTVVQPTLASTLMVVLALAAWLLREPVGRREVAALAAMTAGIAVLVAVAPPHGNRHAAGPVLAGAMTALAAAGLAPLVVRRAALGRSAVALSAGAAFALCNIATKLFSDSLATSGVLVAGGWLAVVVASAAAGGITQTSALQSRPAAQVVSIAFATETLVPVLLAPVLFGEHWWGTSGAQAGARMLAMVGVTLATVLLATSRSVAGAVAGRALNRGQGWSRPTLYHRLVARPAKPSRHRRRLLALFSIVALALVAGLAVVYHFGTSPATPAVEQTMISRYLRLQGRARASGSPQPGVYVYTVRGYECAGVGPICLHRRLPSRAYLIVTRRGRALTMEEDLSQQHLETSRYLVQRSGRFLVWQRTRISILGVTQDNAADTTPATLALPANVSPGAGWTQRFTTGGTPVSTVNSATRRSVVEVAGQKIPTVVIASFSHVGGDHPGTERDLTFHSPVTGLDVRFTISRRIGGTFPYQLEASATLVSIRPLR
jgi:drug/metabolite transporter (DMT)-like permease